MYDNNSVFIVFFFRLTYGLPLEGEDVITHVHIHSVQPILTMKRTILIGLEFVGMIGTVVATPLGNGRVGKGTDAE